MSDCPNTSYGWEKWEKVNMVMESISYNHIAKNQKNGKI
jgi:hypothetical protein